jgi:nuclear cap-binding protein subunit 1
VKTPVYGTLVGLINAKNADFGKDVVNRAGERLQQALNERNALDVKLLTRFVAELVNAHVVAAGDLLGLFELLLASASSEAGLHSDLEYYAYVILITLPFAAHALLRDLPASGLEDLLSTLHRYVHTHKSPVNPLLLVYPEPQVLSRESREKDYLSIIIIIIIIIIVSISLLYRCVDAGGVCAWPPRLAARITRPSSVR